MRRLAVIAVVAVAAATGAWLGRDSAGEPRALFPDLDQDVPTAVTVRLVRGRYVLAFAAAVDNVGAGPLVVEARREPGERPMRATQVGRGGDGSERRFRIAPTVRYERAETHAHWHLIGFERYELRSLDGSVVLRARKAGFCLGDRYESRRSVRLAGEPPGPVWTGECGKGRPELRAMTQGISVGYGEDYAPRLEGQFVDVTDVPPGRYVLVHLANPDRVLRESDYANNAASALVVLRRAGRGERLPSVAVVARCEGAADCRA